MTMRILCLEGKFGYVDDIVFKGFIVFCHIEPNDNEKILSKALSKLLPLAKEQFVIVPFVHLDKKVAPHEIADKLFAFFCDTAKKLSKVPVVVVPFGVKKEFNLYAPADNAAIKFKRFTH